MQWKVEGSSIKTSTRSQIVEFCRSQVELWSVLASSVLDFRSPRALSRCESMTNTGYKRPSKRFSEETAKKVILPVIRDPFQRSTHQRVGGGAFLDVRMKFFDDASISSQRTIQRNKEGNLSLPHFLYEPPLRPFTASGVVKCDLSVSEIQTAATNGNG